MIAPELGSKREKKQKQQQYTYCMECWNSQNKTIENGIEYSTLYVWNEVEIQFVDAKKKQWTSFELA